MENECEYRKLCEEVYGRPCKSSGKCMSYDDWFRDRYGIESVLSGEFKNKQLTERLKALEQINNSQRE